MSEFLDKTGLAYFWSKVKAKIADSAVKYATSAGTATKAIQDGLGQTISSTYIKDVSISGKTLKNSALNYTIGDGNRVSEILDFLNMVYPVGSFYISATKTTDPNKIFGGTWMFMSNFKFTDNTSTCDVWQRIA